MKRFLHPRVYLALLVTSLALFSSVNFGQQLRNPRVPAGQTYVYLDRNRKEVSRRTAGQSARSTNATQHCVKITCPDNFEKNVVCWSCTTTSSVKQR